MIKKTVFLAGIFFSIFFSISGAAPVHAKDDSLRLIQKAYLKGDLDYRTALNYKVYSVFRKQRLPKEFQSESPAKSATPIVMEAKKNRHLLYKENEFVLFRPTDAGDIYRDYYGSGVLVWAYDSPGGRFRIHYTEDNSHGDAVTGSDGNYGTIPQYVVNLASYLDFVWNREVNVMGYRAPPSDGAAGGDGRFDVYLKNISAYGYTAYDNTPADVYMVINNSFSGFPSNLDPEGLQKGSMKVTAAHEFFHACQYQYSPGVDSSIWWMEASATWMEDAVYPQVKDYLNYLGLRYDDMNDNGVWDDNGTEKIYNIDGTLLGTTGRSSIRWFDHQELPLDTDNGRFEYGDVIWAKYLSENLPAKENAVKNIWVRMTTRTAAQAITDELTSSGLSLDAALAGFRRKVLTREFIDGAYYPLVRHDGSYSAYPQTVSGLVDHLSARYYALKPDADSNPLNLEFSGIRSAGVKIKLLLKKRADGAYDEMEAAAAGNTVVSDFGRTAKYSRIEVVVMNMSAVEDAAGFAFTASHTIPPPDASGQAGGGGGSCFIATAAYGSYLAPEVKLLRDFRDSHLLTNPAGRAFVGLYYRASPPLARFIAGHESLRLITRLVLSPLVYGIKYPFAAAWGMVLPAFTIIISGAIIISGRRKRRG